MFDPPAEQRELVRRFTLTATDLAAALRCRGELRPFGKKTAAELVEGLSPQAIENDLFELAPLTMAQIANSNTCGNR